MTTALGAGEPGYCAGDGREGAVEAAAHEDAEDIETGAQRKDKGSEV